ncbi:unnamed protein product, partial [Rotaria sp. Silwood2]
MTQLHDNIVGIDAAIFMHPTTWKASGHVDNFSDPMIDNKDSNKRYRVDHLIESYAEELKAAGKEQDAENVLADMDNLLGKDDYAGLKKLIEERIKLILVDVNVFIKTNNFYEIEQKINFITIVSDLLGPFCTNYIFEQIEELNKNLDKIISNIVERYREMDISAYILNPPTDICDKLEKIRDRNLKYTQVFNVIKELILNKFRKELDEAKKKQPPNPINIHIRKFESRIKYLPKDMQECLEIEVKYCKDDIQKNMEYNIKNLKDTCDSRDLKHIKKMIQDYQQTEGMQYYVNQGRVYVL